MFIRLCARVCEQTAHNAAVVMGDVDAHFASVSNFSLSSTYDHLAFSWYNLGNVTLAMHYSRKVIYIYIYIFFFSFPCVVFVCVCVCVLVLVCLMLCMCVCLCMRVCVAVFCFYACRYMFVSCVSLSG